MVFLLGILFCQEIASPPGLTADEIVAKMVAMDRARMAELVEYTSIRRYSLENTRFHTTAEATVEMRYRHPGKKEFSIISESGSSLIRQRVLRRMMDSELEASSPKLHEATQITPRNYEFHLLRTDTERGRTAYLFDITPKVENKFTIKGRVWIDAQDFAIVRIEGTPAKKPSFWVRTTHFVHTYQKFGRFWLAVSNVSQTDAVFFGHTSVEIEYTDYKVNPGKAERARITEPRT